eukprot:TRINITY_DN6810_c0_g2_i1.p1 TRINITY_DN6810_c0_g2~~TRINITY_DN6810_c0_g2_i1.p1  ORF type:complete len:1654 (+),score=631.62 TRINITY_DN6810_c0_g2_i1:388-4962(+)
MNSSSNDDQMLTGENKDRSEAVIAAALSNDGTSAFIQESAQSKLPNSMDTSGQQQNPLNSLLNQTNGIGSTHGGTGNIQGIPNASSADALMANGGLNLTNPSVLAQLQGQSQLNHQGLPEGIAQPMSVSQVEQAITNANMHNPSAGTGQNARVPMQTGGNSSNRTMDKPSFTSLNVDTLLMANQNQSHLANEEVQDHIHFTFNNLSKANVTAQVQSLMEVVDPSIYPFLAQYLVVKRVSMEPNYHNVYLQFVEQIDSPELDQLILMCVLRNVQILLVSDQITTSTTERALLKNLGSWLGKTTLAKNKPLLAKHLHFKNLILEAFQQARLIAVIPFIAKTLESCKKANKTVFAVPNPWTLAMLRLLAEVYSFEDLKLNLKFEIEVLCQNLGVDLSQLEPTRLLTNVIPIAGDDFANKTNSKTGMAAKIARNMAYQQQLLQQQQFHQQNQAAHLQQGAEDLLSPNQLLSGSSASSDSSDPGSFFTISPNIALFQQQPDLARLVYAAFDRAIREVISMLMDRSVSLAVQTTVQMVLKDFGTEPDERKLRTAAHMMVTTLATSHISASTRDSLNKSIQSHLHSLLSGSLNSNQEQVQKAIEQAIQIVTQDNLERAQSLIEKAATEKAIHELDAELMNAYVARQTARERGQPFQGSLPSSSTVLPEVMMAKSGGLHQNQLRVYEDWGRLPNVAGKMQQHLQQQQDTSSSSSSSSASTGKKSMPSLQEMASAQVQQNANGSVRTNMVVDEQAGDLTPQRALEIIQGAAETIDVFVGKFFDVEFSKIPMDSDLHRSLYTIAVTLSRSKQPMQLGITIAQRVFQRLLESPRAPLKLPQHVDLVLLEIICDICGSVIIDKELTAWATYTLENDPSPHIDLLIALVRMRLVNVPSFAAKVASMVEKSGSTTIISVAFVLVKQCVLDEKVCTSAEFKPVLDILALVAERNKDGRAQGLLEEASQVANAVSRPSYLRMRGEFEKLTRTGMSQQQGTQNINSILDASDSGPDAEKLRDLTTNLLQEWMSIYQQKDFTDDMFITYVAQLEQHHILQEDEMSLTFFKFVTEICVKTAVSGKLESSSNNNSGTVSANESSDLLDYSALDAYAKLIVLLVKYSGGTVNTQPKVNLLTRVLFVIVRVLVKDYEGNPKAFNQRPYFRLFSLLLSGLVSSETGLEAISTHVLSAFSNTFHLLQPLNFPGFAFAWLDLISHRQFMPYLLLAQASQGWALFQTLMVDMFKFLGVHIKTTEMSPAISKLYRGTLKVLLVLLHDFPEFLCDYHFSFCDVIPPVCIQMRNLILSAFPRNMRLPDAFTPNLKVDLLPETHQPPRILSDYMGVLGPVRNEIDTYLVNWAPARVLDDLKTMVLLPQEEQERAGTVYNLPLINSLVLYVGMQGMVQLQNASQQSNTSITNSPSMDIYKQLFVDLDPEGRYMFVNAIANHLRYPNSHTHYFSCVLLSLFDKQGEYKREQITRVLLERLIVNRPTPWGLLITFMELIKNQRYNFWGHSFVHCDPEIERVFDTVARLAQGGGGQNS